MEDGGWRREDGGGRWEEEVSEHFKIDPLFRRVFRLTYHTRPLGDLPSGIFRVKRAKIILAITIVLGTYSSFYYAYHVHECLIYFHNKRLSSSSNIF